MELVSRRFGSGRSSGFFRAEDKATKLEMNMTMIKP
jgi:hypothetical protein